MLNMERYRRAECLVMQLTYAELFCLTNFSFLKAASHPEECVERAAALGYRAIAITDECSVAGVVRAHMAAKKHNIALIVGTHIFVEELSATLILLAHTREGYGDMSAAISRARNRAKKGEYHALKNDFEALNDCTAILHCALDTQASAVAWLKHTFGECAALGVALHRHAHEDALIAHAEMLGAAHAVPRVALGDVRFHIRARKAAHDVLTAIRLKKPLSECGAEVLQNSEPHLRSRARLAALYPLQWIMHTSEIAARCSFDLKTLAYEYPREIVPEAHTPASWLRACTEVGAKVRYKNGTPAKVQTLIEHELVLIAELKAEAFFLTVYDVVAFARSKNILCQGRGSAANSAVCFCLGITEVDPDRTTVLFERFMSKERDEPPDIDVDFEHERREEVMQYIYQKYGRHRAALAAAVNMYRTKSALRDSGKALGLSLDQVDRLTSVIAWWDGAGIKTERLLEARFDPHNPRLRKVLLMAHTLRGFPRHLSQHSGGFVIARDDLTRLVPVENAAMPDRTVIQWDKDDLEALGLLKVDVLALGVLTAIRKAFDLVNGWRVHEEIPSPSGGGLGRGSEHLKRLTVADIKEGDAPTYDMICKADTLGVFQIESRAQMAMLPRLRPRCFYDLVIEVALIRPGPITGGMVHPYLRRRNGLEKVSYPSPAVEKVLERTLGVSIFQEQVMQLAVVAAGFTAGEADQLRRAMAAWKKKGGLEPFQKKLIEGMTARGYAQAYAEQIYAQICGFGEYGFPESHAASFALLAYQSAWLKCHYPAAYAAALINSQPMGFYTPSQIVQDAARHGVRVLPADVCVSEWNCTLEKVAAGKNPALRLGLRLVKGLNEEAALQIESARSKKIFTNVDDLAQRAALNSLVLVALSRADALATLAGHRRKAYWETLGYERDAGLVQKNSNIATKQFELPAAHIGQEVIADYQFLGLTLRAHPLSLMREVFNKQRIIRAQDLVYARHHQIVRVSGLVTCRQRPETAKGVTFVTLEDETGMMNIVVWTKLGERQRNVLLQAQLMTVFGHIECESGVIHVIAGQLRDDSAMLAGLTMKSRDFH
jgi:error-prone DNA polymerase